MAEAMTHEIKPSLEQSLLLQALEQISALDTRIGVMQGQINLVLHELQRIAPLVDKHEDRHNQAVGAVHVGRWIWTVIAGGAGAMMMSVISWLLSSGHPPAHTP